ncbi:hypothetical protein BC629DRAFT_1562733 [Irpex lacteus]|nr:hypothetical protein BC629DRAFT_1562733 [Irpex lacteus]
MHTSLRLIRLLLLLIVMFLVASGNAMDIVSAPPSSQETTTPRFEIGGSSLTSQDFAPRDTLTLDYVLGKRKTLSRHPQLHTTYN